jgi:ABC-type branched-subunit amino acid transport system substrate-binding protein
MKGKPSVLFTVLLLASLLAIPLLSGCAGGKEEATPTPAASPTATARATATPTATPTATAPATATPAATPTATAAATGTPAATPTATAAATGTATPAAEVPGITDTQITLGASLILGGVFGAAFRMIPDATNAYFKYINDTQGGVCGRQIVYKMEDNNNDAAQGLEAARKLIERDQVFALVGNLGDDSEAAAWDYINEQGVPDIFVSAGTHRFGTDPEGHPWTIPLIPSYTVEGTFFGQYISEHLAGEKVAALYENGPQGWDELAGLKLGLDPAKNELATEQSFELTDISIRSQVANMKNSGATIAVLLTGPGQVGQAIKEADRLGWKPQWVISYTAADDILFQFVSPPLLEGAITFQAFKLATMKDDPAVARHYDIMRDYGGPAPSNFTIYAQLVGELTVEALSRTCDNLTREGLINAVESIKDWHSDLLLDEVNVTFSHTDHIGLQTGRMLRIVVEDGKASFEYFGPLYVFEG